MHAPHASPCRPSTLACHRNFSSACASQRQLNLAAADSAQKDKNCKADTFRAAGWPTMHLTKLVIKNLCKLQYAELSFQACLNVLVGGNNICKTAVVEALRKLLAGARRTLANVPLKRIGLLGPIVAR